MEPLVSIIVPVYNAAQYLEKTLVNLLKQTYQNREILVIDDSSTDNSYDICKRFERFGIKVFRQPNQGAAAARNFGLKYSKGEYIQFMDADDLLTDNKIEMQVSSLENCDNKVSVCNFVQFESEPDFSCSPDISNQRNFIFSSDDPADFLVNLWGGYGIDGFIQTNCWLTPKRLIDNVCGWRNYRCPDDDGEFFTRVLLQSKGIVHTKGCMVYYRMTKHGNQLSGSKEKHLVKNALLTIDLKYKYLSAYRNDKHFKIAMAKQYLYYAVYNYPQNLLLSKIAERRYKMMKSPVESPPIGGKIFNFFAYVFGWKVARRLRYLLKK